MPPALSTYYRDVVAIYIYTYVCLFVRARGGCADSPYPGSSNAVSVFCFAVTAGKRALLRNSAGALTLSAAVVYGGEWFKRRMMARTEGWSGKGDCGPPRP